MKYKNILFDLDGTLTDSKPGIVKSICKALQYFGIDYSAINLDLFIGPPLMNSLVDMGINHQKAEEIVKIYREYYGKEGIYENSLYESISEMLACLKTNGHTLIIATAKSQPYANIVLDNFNIAQYFTCISASDINRTFDTKQRIIEDALKVCDITNLNSTVMIGDRKYDITAAKAVGIAAIGVLFGYGDYDELNAAGADIIVENVQELFHLLRGEN